MEKENLDLEVLQNFIANNKTPTIKGKPKTFLSIAKQPHYENVLSNIYAFYFNVNEVHKLKDLFIVSLLELINEAEIGIKKDISFHYEFSIDTEYSTDKGGRIDLLLSTDEEAIIIENKVYHHIDDNDLDDYWDTIKGSSNNKIGIILSLNTVPKNNYSKFNNTGQFINITHLELLNKVMEKLGTYILTSNDKYLVFLKDLYQNITNLSKSYMEEKDLKFYFNNQEEINQITKFKFSVREHIINEVENAGKSLSGLKLYSPRPSSDLGKRVRYFKSEIDENLMIAVVFEDILKANKFRIVVELKNDGLKNREKYKNVEFTENEEALIAESNFYTNTNKSWAHFAKVEYPVTEKEVAHLSQFIIEKLEEGHLLSIFNKLNNYLFESKKVREVVS